MNNYERCAEILGLLKKTRRYWSHYIDDFVDSFIALPSDEQRRLARETNADVRCGFMLQILGHVRREFQHMRKAEKRKVLYQAYVLILFENFEYEYRDTILEVRKFSCETAKYPRLKKEAWGKVEHLLQENTRHYMGDYF